MRVGSGRWVVKSNYFGIELSEKAAVLLLKKKKGGNWAVFDVGDACEEGQAFAKNKGYTECRIINPFDARCFDAEIGEAVIRHYVQLLIRGSRKVRKGIFSRVIFYLKPLGLDGTLLLQNADNMDKNSIGTLTNKLTEFGMFKSITVTGLHNQPA